MQYIFEDNLEKLSQQRLKIAKKNVKNVANCVIQAISFVSMNYYLTVVETFVCLHVEMYWLEINLL